MISPSSFVWVYNIVLGIRSEVVGLISSLSDDAISKSKTIPGLDDLLLGEQVVGPGGGNSGFIGGDNGTIGVGNEGTGGGQVAVAIATVGDTGVRDGKYGHKGKEGKLKSEMKVYMKKIDPLGRPTVTAGSDHCFHTSVSPSPLFKSIKTKTNFKRKQGSLLARL